MLLAMGRGRWLGAVLVVGGAALLPAQNSTRKIRPRPSEVAAKAGSAVHWRADLDSARQESTKTGKPVFWYVPTVRGTPMDRKQEIDRYMMAGPFSWPRLILLLNQHYIPVKATPRGGLAHDLALRPGRFIEPGYVVLAPDGKELRRLDKITTLHPEWFLGPLAKLVNKAVPKRELPAPLAAARRALQTGDYPKVGEALNLHVPLAEAWRAEACYLTGVAALRQGRSDQALKLWQMAKDKYPDSNFGWKCAAEVEGHGPCWYGFEVYRELPAKALEGTAPGSRAPAGAYDEDQLRQRSIRFLLGMQRSNGSYTDSRYDFGGTDSLPNVHFACTALINLAFLLEFFEQAKEEEKSGPKKGPDKLGQAIDSAMKFLAEKSNLNTEDRDELIWAYAYRARLLAECLISAPPYDDAAVDRHRLSQLVKAILELQPSSGQWFHEYQNPFATATVLQTLALAKQAGVKVDSARVARGIGALKRCRGDNGGFTYHSVRRGKPRTVVQRAAGRMPLCELALLLWGESDQKKLRHAIEASIEHHHLLESVRKYDDHATLGYGGFFFWFDMLGRTDAILALTDKDLRGKLLKKQRDIVLAIPEIDGCFVDSHELGRTYGTAMALICLAKMRSR